ncbi:hypothetical protein HQ560_05160, partial [bacterium]|nr:hypothetical protein [bacterium]
CVGCHEERGSTAPAGKATLAMRRPASEITPIPGDLPDVYDFPRDIQPILDKHCVKCHDVEQHGTYTEGEGAEEKPCGPLAGGISLASDRGPIFSHAYANLTMLAQFTDGRDGNSNKAPRTIGTGASPLMGKISSGKHYGVKVTPRERDIVRLWIDSSAVYAGTYAALGTGMARGKPAIPKMCNECHKKDELQRRYPGLGGGGQAYGNPMTVRFNEQTLQNLSRPEYSRIVLAPLSKEVGGYGICEEKSGQPVFTSRKAQAFQSLLAAIEKNKDQLDRIKRFDMPDFVPSKNYLREMKRFGVLPVDHDDAAPVDFYELDQKYWKSHWVDSPATLEAPSKR